MSAPLQSVMLDAVASSPVESPNNDSANIDESELYLHTIAVEVHEAIISSDDELIVELVTDNDTPGDVYLFQRKSPTLWRCDEKAINIPQDAKTILLVLYTRDAGEVSTDLGYVTATREEMLLNNRLVKDVIDPFANDDEGAKIQLRSWIAGSASPPQSYEDGYAVLTERLDHFHATIASHYSDDAQNPSRADALLQVGNCYVRRFKASLENRADIDTAISIFHDAITIKAAELSTIFSLFLQLIDAYHLRYDATRNIRDISESIEAALPLIDSDHTFRDEDLPMVLDKVAELYTLRFKHIGDSSDLDEAMALLHKAAHLAPNRPAILGNLTILLQNRFSITGDVDDLNEGILFQRRGIDLVPEDDDEFPEMLTNLASALESRFQLYGDLNDIDEAIENNRRALRLSQEGHPKIPDRLAHLGISLRSRFITSGDDHDLNEAIAMQKEALNLVPPGHPTSPVDLYNISRSLQLRFDRFKDSRDLQECREALQEAITLTPADHTIIARVHYALGESFRDERELSRAIHHFRLSTLAQSGAPFIRIRAASGWAMCSLASGDQTQFIEAYTIAFDLLPRLAWIGESISRRHQEVKKIAEHTHMAVTFAIELQQHTLALQWSEQARCIVRNQLSNLRTPMDALYELDPELAANLHRVANALEMHGHMETPKGIATANSIEDISAQHTITKTHHQLARQWDELVIRTRQLPRFERFLLPVTFSQLSEAMPEEGPVVLINGHELYRVCNALVIMQDMDQVIHIPLKDFSYSKAEKLRNSLSRCLASHNLRAREARTGRPADFTQMGPNHISSVLSELWICLVKPILDALGYPPTANPPRLWFCPTGPLTFLPIHAAGIYQTSNGVQRTTISDYVIASYTPTISTIADIRRQGKRSTFRGVLSVSQPDIPELPLIPNTAKESLDIQNAFTTSNLVSSRLDGISATLDNVLDGMMTMSWVHLACHAIQDVSQPAKSGFYLNDGCLDFSTLIQKNFPHADFAFLSACQTSMGHEELSEEAVHLASGMLSAGYRGIIASMWSIDDESAPKIAQEVYSYLLRNVELDSGPDSSQAAYALHHAIQNFRKQYGDNESSLLCWVPFVHWGM